MPIEFRCPQCHRLLQTPDDTAGRQAQCPECGAISVIRTPEAGPGEAAPPPPLQPEVESIYQAPRGYAKFSLPTQYDGKAVASVALGAATLFFGCCCGLLGLPFGIAGLILGIMALRTQSRNLAVVGIVLNALAIVVTLILITINLYLLATGQHPLMQAR